MDVTRMQTFKDTKCKICKKKVQDKIIFGNGNIEIAVFVCSDCYNFVNANYRDVMRKQISSIKSIFEINKSIKFFEATNIKTKE